MVVDSSPLLWLAQEGEHVIRTCLHEHTCSTTILSRPHLSQRSPSRATTDGRQKSGRSQQRCLRCSSSHGQAVAHSRRGRDPLPEFLLSHRTGRFSCIPPMKVSKTSPTKRTALRGLAASCSHIAVANYWIVLVCIYS